MAAALRAGLVGLGSMGRHHARVLREMPGVDLVGAVDPSGDPFAVAGGVPVYREVAELIAAGVDMAVVAAPTVTHEPVGLELAAAGVHTMVEKPIAADVVGAQRLVEAFEAAGLVGAVGTSSGSTRRCSRCAGGCCRARSARSTRSSPAARARSRSASRTSAWSRTWRRTTST